MAIGKLVNRLFVAVFIQAEMLLQLIGEFIVHLDPTGHFYTIGIKHSSLSLPNARTSFATYCLL
ncbi:hypothetical protein SAMN02745203_01305 [Porphyromonas crevioricanis]|nr:hypothetical protein SAMN02745203_01305 [Porphyromonas crevioricanis]